jgi:hypothetical protein
LSRVSSKAESASALRWPLIYTGVALTTLATLLLELTLTRIFSVVFYYHMAFLAISIALFGLGAGGVFSYVVATRAGQMFHRIGTMAVLASVVLVGALAFILTQSGELTNFKLAVTYLVSALPFFLTGAIVSLAISETIDRVDRVYFFDLLGAAGGCLILIPLLDRFGGPNTVIAAGVLLAATAAIWFTLAGSLWGRIVAVIVGLGLVGLTVINMSWRVIDVRYAKGQELLGEQFVKWNSFSRIALAFDPNRYITIFIDADASTGLPRYNFDSLLEQERAGLLKQGPGLPYAMRPGAKTLIIGPGGGYDIARALASGSKDITGVEINSIIADTIMRERFRYLSNGIYLRPEVSIFVEDGRSSIRRSQDRYQVLQATLVDTWASTAAGAFALSENNLYTVEAFEDYLRHLTDDGLMAFTRWGFEPPRESLRLISLAMEALESLGENEPWKHVIVARENVGLLKSWGATDTVLISRKPFPLGDLDRARRLLRESRIVPVYLPGDRNNSAFARLLRAPDRDAFYRSYDFDVSPVTDNRPFFFYTVQPQDLWTFFFSGREEVADHKINRAVPLLYSLVGVSLLATIVMLSLPPLLLRSRLPQEPGVRTFLFYFVAIGVGYILIQVALIQKFVLFLGHPIYALTVVVFSMLVASSAGSYFSRRIGAFETPVLNRVLLAVFGLVALLALVLIPLSSAAVGWPLPARVAITILLIAPAAFAMGMPFPSGLSRLERWHKPSVRWAWSLNAASSVLGSAMSIFLALYLGLRETLLIGAVLYLCALLALRSSRHVAMSNLT